MKYLKITNNVLIVSGLLVGFLVFFPGQTHACSFPEGFERPTPASVLADGGGVFITKVLENGNGVLGEVVRSTFILPRTVEHRHATHSCTMRMEPFYVGEYIVTVNPESPDVVITYVEADAQFSYSFDTLREAEEKYNEFIAMMPESVSPSTPEPEEPPLMAPEPTPEVSVVIEPEPVQTFFDRVMAWFVSLFRR